MKHGAIEITTRTILFLVIFLVITVIVIMIGLQFGDAGTNSIGSMQETAELFCRGDGCL